MLIRRDEIWTRPPQHAAGIAAPYRGGVILSAGNGLYDAVNSRPIAMPSTLAYGIDSRLGRVVKNSSQSSNAVDLGRGITTNDWTAVFVGSFVTGSSGYDTFAEFANGGYRLKFDNAYNGQSKFSVVIHGVAQYDSGVAARSGVPCVLIFSGTNGGTYDCVVRWLDDRSVSKATGVSIGAPSLTSGSSYLLSEATAPYGPAGGSALSIAGFLPRRMSVAEAVKFTENPWQIFEDEEEFRFVPAAGGGGSSTSLSIFNGLHTHYADSFALNWNAVFGVSDSVHSHTSDAVTLSTASLLGVADAVHTHAADSLTLDTSTVINLAPTDASHSHAADSIALTVASVLAASDATHAHSADSPELSTAAFLVIAEAAHTHLADNLALSSASVLTIAEAVHSLVAENIALSVAAYLTIAEAVHSHLADNLTLDITGATLLTTQDADHAHTAGAVVLTLDTWLAIVDAAHSHNVDSPTLSSQQSLIVAEALHAHFADVLVLSLPISGGGTGATAEEIAAAVWAYVSRSLTVQPTPAQIAQAVWDHQIS